MERKIKTHTLGVIYTAILLALFSCISSTSFAQSSLQENSDVELNGDVVEYSVDGNTVIATGNVVIIRAGTTLFCDEVEFQRNESLAFARGNVRLITSGAEIEGEKLTYNFEDGTGQFHDARLYSDPYFGAGRVVNKVSDNKLEIEDGFVSTSDFDDPEYRLKSKRIDVYMNDRVVANHVTLHVDKMPLMYLPRYTQNLDDTEPRIVFIPGYDDELGAFLLSRTRFDIGANIQGKLLLDWYALRGVGVGTNIAYQVPDKGEGTIETYYIGDKDEDNRPNASNRIERYKTEWRHKWQIDEKTSAIAQVYKLSDSTFLKDFFENEFDEDSNPDTFFLLTKVLPVGTFSLRVDKRVNRFEGKVERLPEIKYSIGNQELGESNIFLKTENSFTKLTRQFASPSEVRKDTMRFDSDTELSYPFKLSFVEIRPFIGTRQTYYSKTVSEDDYKSIRGQFKTGASLQTKFYRVFDVDFDKFGMEINRLRHIVTPSINYFYSDDATMQDAEIDQFDSLDSATRNHQITFSIENKLQTKRNNKNVDLLRFVNSVPFKLKEDPGKGGFGSISTDIDFLPTDWLTLYFDSEYDTKKDHLTSANFDIYINGKNDVWSFGLGKRYNREVDDQITTNFFYKINEKWSISTYNRLDVLNGIHKEQEYILTRDLHSWIMDLRFNETRGEGNEIVVIFTLKAFPDIELDAGTKYNRRKSGSN